VAETPAPLAARGRRHVERRVSLSRRRRALPRRALAREDRGVAAERAYQAPEQHGRTWDRGGGNHYNRSYMHKTKSVDYGILLSGERVMELDDCTLTLKPGDVVIDVGAWPPLGQLQNGAA
jgi:hypothetical protein